MPDSTKPSLSIAGDRKPKQRKSPSEKIAEQREVTLASKARYDAQQRKLDAMLAEQERAAKETLAAVAAAKE